MFITSVFGNIVINYSIGKYFVHTSLNNSTYLFLKLSLILKVKLWHYLSQKSCGRSPKVIITNNSIEQSVVITHTNFAALWLRISTLLVVLGGTFCNSKASP